MPEEASDPEVVYHYTALDTLVKIVQSKRLWATSIAYLNDTSERNLYVSQATKRLPALLEAHPEIQKVMDPEERSMNFPWDFETAFAAYVTSFSLEDDSLPQWRAYTPAGLGVSIGFKVECLKMAKISYESHEALQWPVKPDGTLRFSKVTYLERAGRNLGDDKLLNIYSEAVADFIKRQNDQRLVGRFDVFLENRLGSIGCTHKNDAFRNENEYRLILDGLRWPTIPLGFRSAKSTLVPYVQLDIPDSSGKFGQLGWNAIKSIRIGPTPNEKLTMPAVAALAFTSGIGGFELTNSGATFREV